MYARPSHANFYGIGENKINFYQVLDPRRVCVLNLEASRLQRQREGAIVDLYHDASNSQGSKMLFSCNCIFAQGYCSYTTLNSIVSQPYELEGTELLILTTK